MKEVETYIDAVTALVPATDRRLQEIREELLSDATCSNVIDYCTKGWPRIISADLVPFKRVAADLWYARGLLSKGDRLVIPKMLRCDVVKNIHEGHQGISKCSERANSAVWWPGINQQLAEFVAKCPVCTKYRQINSERMMPSNLPSYPWKKVGCDLFQFNNATSCGRLFFQSYGNRSSGKRPFIGESDQSPPIQIRTLQNRRGTTI